MTIVHLRLPIMFLTAGVKDQVQHRTGLIRWTLSVTDSGWACRNVHVLERRRHSSEGILLPGSEHEESCRRQGHCGEPHKGWPPSDQVSSI